MTNLNRFKDIVRSGDFVVIDTETTGLVGSEICQIAIVDSQGNTLLDTLVRPIHTIPLKAIEIHGIDNGKVQDAPNFAEVREQARVLMLDQNVISYNAVFDRGMLHSSADHAGLPKWSWKEFSAWHCAMLAFAEIYGDWNSYHGNYRWKSLKIAADYYQVEQRSAHTALDDCLTTLAVCRGMIADDDRAAGETR